MRTSFCKNLHAKCYLNEETCIITSLNLYEFSQVNNNEMGVLLTRADDATVYREAYEEALRIIRISDEVRISLERVTAEGDEGDLGDADGKHGKLTTSKLAKKLGVKTDSLLAALTDAGYLSCVDGKHSLTEKGQGLGAEYVPKSRFGAYFYGLMASSCHSEVPRVFVQAGPCWVRFRFGILHWPLPAHGTRKHWRGRYP